MEEEVNPSPKSQAGKSPLVGCPRLFIQCLRILLPYLGGHLLCPQSEDATLSGVRDTLVRARLYEIALMIASGHDSKQSSLLTRGTLRSDYLIIACVT